MAIQLAKERDTLWKKILKNRMLYLFILPTIALIAIFSYYPAVSAIYRSFFEWDGAFHSVFRGFRNFVDAFKDEVLQVSALHMLIIVVFSLVRELVFPLLGALLVFHLRYSRAAYTFRTLLVIPIVVPGIVILLIWRFLYNPSIGLINQLLTVVGMESLTQNWLGDPRFSLLSVAFIGFPWAGGFPFLIYLAGLQNITSDIFDASTVDGATGIKRFLYVELPLILGQVKLLVMLTIITVIQSYQNYLILTQGGPGLSSMVPGLHMYYTAFRYQKFGYGSAIGVILFAIIFILTVINKKYFQGGVESA